MTVRKFFGTDGIRGTANAWPVTPEIAMRLGMAAATYFRKSDPRRHLVVIGKDTRLSGYMLEPALTAGFTAAGMDVVLFGPLPTPAVAMLTRSLRADLGVMLSASHNKFADNGIKLFGPDGYKMSDDAEAEIEQLMDQPLDQGLAPADKLGRTRRIDDAQARYIEIVKATFPRGLRLSGLRVVIDAANGAAYKVAPAALYELGAEVIKLEMLCDKLELKAGDRLLTLDERWTDSPADLHESATRCNSWTTKRGTTSVPPTKPVLAMSTIRPSISTLVSSRS